MLKRNITYTDYNDNRVTETFYFNLTKSELIEMEMGIDGGFGEHLQRIVKAQNGPALIAEFKKLILSSYGVKSDDGKRFMKSPELQKEFAETAAYNELFLELAGDENAATVFIEGIMPKDMAERKNEVNPSLVDPRDPAFAAMQAVAATSQVLPPPTNG